MAVRSQKLFELFVRLLFARLFGSRVPNYRANEQFEQFFKFILKLRLLHRC